MKITKSHLDAAVERDILTLYQATELWTYFNSLHPDRASFRGLHVLYYSGGVLILASMSWLLTNAWDNGSGIMVVSALFAFFYVFWGNHLWRKQVFKIPGGLLITAAVGLTPVFIYGFQLATGLWPQEAAKSYQSYHLWVKGSWFFMEIGTIVAALVALKFFRFTFITFPLAITLWYMSMDLSPLLFGRDDFGWEGRKIVSCIFGLVVFQPLRRQPRFDFPFGLFATKDLSHFRSDRCPCVHPASGVVRFSRFLRASAGACRGRSFHCLHRNTVSKKSKAI